MNKHCVHCQSENLTAGIVQTADALKLCFVPDDQRKKLLPKAQNLTAFVCNDCGHLSFFVK
ncbi:MAG: hypothetical protein IJC17_07815 [Clostridia bacterium]|nr:hypothetical protein [Clostridia bacterium]